MIHKECNFWNWKKWKISWSLANVNKKTPTKNVLLIHGFGASKGHWRYNQNVLGEEFNCFAIDLLGFGDSSQPFARLDYESPHNDSIKYCFDLWGEQIRDFCNVNIKGQVILIGNSIGGIVALKAAEMLENKCDGVILIDCAQRTMDDKRLKKNDILMNFLRPIIKTAVRTRFISNTIFKRAANPKVIKEILKKAYPSGKNINEELIDILYKPSQRDNSAEAFRGFINLFNDYLPTDLFKKVEKSIYLIWGEKDPWESLSEAIEWEQSFNNIKSLDIIEGAGHCPHDECPDQTNKIILKLVQDIK